LVHEFLEERYLLGANPFDIKTMVRDQYEGGSTIMTAISGVLAAIGRVDEER
jgi:hypothetical protein